MLKKISTLLIAVIIGGALNLAVFAPAVADNRSWPEIEKSGTLDVIKSFILPAKSNSGTAATDSTNVITPISQQEMQKLMTVVSEIKKYYVRKVANDELLDNAISGMLYGLDPHSEYLKKDDLDYLAALTFGKFSGIGVEIAPYQGLIKVISPIDDTPAAKAGIKAGDIIVQIDRKFVKDMQINDALKIIRGPKGTPVNLTIIRKDVPKPLNFTVVRDIVKIKGVKDQMFDGNLGYIRISFFQESTGSDVANAIAKLKKQANGSLRGLVLDLRNNPGGLFDSSVQVVDGLLDIPKNGNAINSKTKNIIVYTKGSSKTSQLVARATPGELLPNVPIVVLINEGSASASEIVAGALQDYERAVIVGTRSFGKGSVQTLIPIDKETAIKLTTSLYYTPLGRSIQAKGIEPDIIIPDLTIPVKEGDVADENLDGFVRIDESSLSDHLQNGNDGEVGKKEGAAMDKMDKKGKADTKKDVSKKDADNLTDKEKQSENRKRSNLIYKDYQLHEALNILKGLAVRCTPPSRPIFSKT